MGIRVVVEQIEGSLKMNQHHEKTNRLGVIEGLSQSAKQSDHVVAQIMNKIEKEKI